MISINSFCCSEKVFIFISIWMIGKSLMKQHYLKKKTKKNKQTNLNMEEIADAGYMHGKRVCKDFEIENLDGYHDFVS